MSNYKGLGGKMKKNSNMLMLLMIGSSYLCWFATNALCQELPMVVIIPSYNNANYASENLLSVFTQNYNNYRVIYIDDCSSDATYANVLALVKQNNMEDRVQVIHNSERRLAMSNWYNAIHSCSDEEIIIHLDGDDKLANDHVLSKINSVYQNGDIWFTYGSYELSTNHRAGTGPYPEQIIKNNSFRRAELRMSHLRTHRAWLFKLIPLEDFLNGDQFFSVACDCAMEFPFIEMASRGHFMHIPEVLYFYNVSPISDMLLRPDQQSAAYNFIIRKPAYEPLDKPILVTTGINDSASLLLLVKNPKTDLDERLGLFALNAHDLKGIHVIFTDSISPADFEIVRERFPHVVWHSSKSNTNLIETIRSAIKSISSNYILLSIYDSTMKRELSLDNCIRMLKKTWTKIFYLSQPVMDNSIRSTLPLVDTATNVYALYSSNNNFDWNVAQLGLTLLAKDFLNTILNEIDNKIDLEQSICSYFSRHHVLGLCFEQDI